jgi:hypothetical protein
MITPEDLDATTAINHIPADICRQIADFLEVFDAVSFKITCNAMKDAISLGILHDSFPALQDLRAHGDVRSGDTILTWVEIAPILFLPLAHTVIFKCTYVDQGWGNRKGKIYISETESNSGSEFLNDNSRTIGLKIIATSPTADHEEKTLILKFKPKAGARYAICYKAGGGGGQQLFIKNPKIQSIIYCPCIELANAMIPIRGTNASSFVSGILRTVLWETIETKEGNHDTERHRNYLEQFKAVGVDLTNELHVESASFIFQELFDK